MFFRLCFADGSSDQFSRLFLFLELSLLFTLHLPDHRLHALRLLRRLFGLLLLEERPQDLHVVDHLLLFGLENDGDALQGLVLLSSGRQMLRLEVVGKISLKISRNLKVVKDFGLADDLGVEVIRVGVHLDSFVAFDLTDGAHALPFQLVFFGQQQVGHAGVELGNLNVEPERIDFNSYSF